MKKICLFFLCVCLLGFQIARAENTVNDIEKDKKPKKEKSETRTGWTFGILPSVAYDADKGFQYGLLSNVYDFGDGSIYPEYFHSLYFEAAYTTKRSGLFRFAYDSKYLIPNHRLKIDVSYLPDALCDFYGYNGYQTVYNPTWSKKKFQGEEGFVSRAFYKSQRDLFRVAADIDGNIGKNWYWSAGIGLLGYKIGAVNIDMINKGKKEENMLPDTLGLYDRYVRWGIIKPNEANGGWHPYLRGGITFDNRDRQQNTKRGMNAEIFWTYNAAFGEDKGFNNLMFNASFRHFVPIYKDYITFAYRLAAQLTVAGDAPFYLNNYYNNLFIQRVLYEGLGGGNTLRGVMRNRITAPGYAFGNVEFRFKICKFDIGKEHFFIGLNPFIDAGMILQPYEIDELTLRNNIANQDPDFDLSQLDDYIVFGDQANIYRPHLSGGIGLKLMMNDNFVLSVDWAAPFDKRDNDGMANIYVKMGYMF
ncbi:MAG: outer membrane protein assembly factor [Bacteroidales bacterium]|nr:outer membrane protein assembly factor [Bacteroidales bacterium]